jgi:dihydroflavonol-4-reductase
MAGAKKLVIGASGFLGSHVTRQLVDRGDDVRVLIRRTSSTKAIEDLDVEYHYGDIFDDAALRTAMAGCDDVFYCVIDTRAWLREPAPLFRTNVEGLRHVLDAAVGDDLRRFVFTSTIGTMGIPAERGPPPKRTSSTGRTRVAPTSCHASRRRTW